MRSAETLPTCELCAADADYCDSVPDADIPGTHPSECGYRLQSLCWMHAAVRRASNTSRVREILVAEGVGHLDRGYACGECVCHDCGRIYFRHPALPAHHFLTVLCDGSVVKL